MKSTKLNDFLPDASAPDEAAVSSGVKSAGNYRMVTEEDIKQYFKIREPFSHKGTYGHALIIAGAPQTMGAALLAAMGCLYAGAGLTSASIPESGLTALNAALPEVMFVSRENLISSGNTLNPYNVIAIGPGLGINNESIALMNGLLAGKQPLIVDADGLELLNSGFNAIAEDSILTPHVKEFDKLFGPHKTWWGRLQTAREKAKKQHIVIVLKNQFTFIIDQQGLVYINPTGNPGMAQGGMGDVLTGVITAYRAQKYNSEISAILGCYFHGKAGDELGLEKFSVTASSLARQLPKTIRNLFG